MGCGSIWLMIIGFGTGLRRALLEGTRPVASGAIVNTCLPDCHEINENVVLNAQEGSVVNGELGFPRKFVKEYGNSLSSPLVFKVPSGATWQIEMVNCDGTICLQKGWQEFVEYYSIAYGYFLVFEYEKTCHFNIFICDKSALEIDYPFSVTDGDHDKENNLEKELQKSKVAKSKDDAFTDNKENSIEKELKEPKVEKSKTDDSVEVLDVEESPNPFYRPSKKMKLENSALQFEAKKCTRRMSGEKQKANEVSARTEPLAMNRKVNNALQRAKAEFKSTKPYFMVELRPSYVHNGTRVSIKASFARKYLKTGRGDVILNDVNGRVWSAKYAKHGKLGSKIFEGWREFSQDNELEVGDVCVFELINRFEITFKVVILREVKDDNKNSILGKSKVRHEKEIISKNPSFKTIIRPGHLDQRCVYVPVEFMAECRQRKFTGNLTLEVENKRWLVKVINYDQPHCQGKLSAGWWLFAKENYLQEGNVCIFELIDGETMLIKVKIVRHVH
ncbi:hypothetical protein JCGZ_01472 [Jatropha curcas]|uniref:TF-B3 domain-containing protein n=1 Tax=Jatropha curcas TaxID=180498 RepID=A0A067L980_JATCU|nr:hypothetical protein JCGZ_01472 [Jatropha curcas]